MSAPDWRSDGRDWPHRESSRFVVSGGVRWHVQVAGSGPVLLLLHGTGAASHSWRDLIEPLSARFTVVVPDLPGHGFTSRLTTPTLPAVARQVAGLLGTLGLAPALVVGHSAGAAVAFQLALDVAPVPVVGFGAALLPFPGIAAALFPTLAKLLFVNPLVPSIMAAQARTPGVIARFLPRATGSTIDPRGVELYARLFARSGHVGGALAMMANWDLAALKARMSEMTVPVRLFHGDRDATVPPAVAVDAARLLSRGEARALAGLGHLAHEEDPAGAAAAILAAADDWGV